MVPFDGGGELKLVFRLRLTQTIWQLPEVTPMK
jgi:hypothetical protein